MELQPASKASILVLKTSFFCCISTIIEFKNWIWLCACWNFCQSKLPDSPLIENPPLDALPVALPLNRPPALPALALALASAAANAVDPLADARASDIPIAPNDPCNDANLSWCACSKAVFKSASLFCKKKIIYQG